MVTELRGGTRCASELGAASGVTPSLLSHHLGVPRDAGVTSQRRGKWTDDPLVGGVLEVLADELSRAVIVEGDEVFGAGSMCDVDELVAR